MTNIPTPIKAAIGLAATALDEARKLPETLPQAATTVPMAVITTAMQKSLQLQQRITELAIRGDAVISQLRGTSDSAPSWATFDDDASPAESKPQAAFDKIDYNTGYDEGDEGERTGRWDAVGVGGTERDEPELPAATEIPPADGPTPEATSPGDATPEATSPADATSSADATPAKKAPAKKAAPRKAEPLEVAAEHAKPSATPNPATMAAEIVHAHEAETAAEAHETNPDDE